MLAPHGLSRRMRLLLVAASGILILAGLFAFTSSSKSNGMSTASTSVRYLALGDSYTIGESVAEADRWPMLLRDRLQAQGVEVEWYKIIARTGWKTKELKEAIDVSQPDRNYNLVSLLIGVNDFFQGRQVDEYQQRFKGLLQTAIDHAGGRKERVFVVSIPDYAFTPLYRDHTEVSRGIDAFNTVNKKVSLAMGVHYIDITPISRQGLEDPDLVAPDGLHPSAKQYAAWVKLMEPTVLAMLNEE